MDCRDTISVIVPVYNVAQYLPECLDSIVHQTYQNLEIILVDDGSTDDSGKICDQYSNGDARIKVIHQENRGAAAARNAGIANASGTYIAFVDADDWIEPDTFEGLRNQMGTADIITAGYWKDYTHSKDKITECLPAGTYCRVEQIESVYNHMLYADNGNFDDTLASIWNKLFRLELVKTFYRELNVSLHYREDTIFVYTYLLRCGSIVVTANAYYHYRIREGSAVSSEYRLFLKDVNEIYLYLDSLFFRHAASDILRPQLQKWIVELSIYGLNEKMGFSEEVKVPIYWMPYQDKLFGKKVVLYGEGKIGKEYRRSLLTSQISPVLWVDQSYAKLRQSGLPVDAPSDIQNCIFDYILIAIKEEEMARMIRKNLEAMGVAPEKILWMRPVTLFGASIGR